MNIRDLIDKNLIKSELKSETKDHLLEEMIELLVQNDVITNKERFKKDIYDRESLGTTGIGFGVAIPHAKSKAVKSPKIAIGISRKGIDYGSVDGEKVFLVFMIAVNEEQSDLHLKVLANLSRKLMHEDFRQKLLKTQNSSDIYDIVCEIE